MLGVQAPSGRDKREGEAVKILVQQPAAEVGVPPLATFLILKRRAGGAHYRAARCGLGWMQPEPRRSHPSFSATG